MCNSFLTLHLLIAKRIQRNAQSSFRRIPYSSLNSKWACSAHTTTAMEATRGRDKVSYYNPTRVRHWWLIDLVLQATSLITPSTLTSSFLNSKLRRIELRSSAWYRTTWETSRRSRVKTSFQSSIIKANSSWIRSTSNKLRLDKRTSTESSVSSTGKTRTWRCKGTLRGNTCQRNGPKLIERCFTDRAYQSKTSQWGNRISMSWVKVSLRGTGGLKFSRSVFNQV